MIPVTIHLVKYDEALTALRALVDREGPDFVYRSPYGTPTHSQGNCVYVDTVGEAEEPSCGLGKVFAESFNVPLENLIAADGGADILSQLALADVHLTRKAEALLFAFQRAQDKRWKYGVALVDAIVEATSDHVQDDTISTRSYLATDHEDKG